MKGRRSALLKRFVVEKAYLGLAGGMNQRKELPGVDGLSSSFQLRLQSVGERQVHVVAAEQECARLR